MSLNTAHASHGVLIHSGEAILLYSDNVTMEFSGQDNPVFKGSKQGRVYLTSHRMIFNSSKDSEQMKSFSFPFVAMSEVDIEQPAFGSNYIKGKIRAQPNGNWNGEAKFKLYFKSGGAIEFGQAMLRAAKMAQRNSNSDAPPPYTPPTGQWYEAPPPAYQPPPQGYYGWVPNVAAFPDQPPPNTVFMTDNPPPYPGIASGNYNQGYGQGGGPPGYMPPGYPAQGGFAPPGGYAPQGGFVAPTTFPLQSGYQPQGGYPSYPGPQSFQGGQAGTFSGQGGYQPAARGAMGFSAGPQPNSKEAEAAQSAYYDPNQPHAAYVPPPAYYEPPPSYNSVNKKQQ
uniref:Vacuolar protein-sorting-associated protein 36 n=1 Tax=Tabanus bromius TaxID=304241 RepID=A0A0K8TNK3_TABBR